MLKKYSLFWILILISAIGGSASGGGCAASPIVVPENPDFLLAEQGFLEADYLTAIKHYQRFLTAQPHSAYQADAYYRIGLCYLAEGEYDQALESLLQARTKATHKSLKGQIMAGIAQTYMCLKNYPEAARYYKRALSIARRELKTNEILFYLGIALMRSDRWREGSARLRELLKTMPQGPLAAPAQERLALPPDTFVVQLGKYRYKDNALKELERFRNEKDINATLKPILIKGEEFYFIWVGSFPDWQSAQKRADEIQGKGVDAIVLP